MNQDQRLVAELRDKLHQLKQNKVVFAHNFERSHYSTELITKYQNNDKQSLEQAAECASVCGRVMLKRGPFYVIQDNEGRIQYYLNKEQQKVIKNEWGTIDIGDIVGVSGTVQRSGKGDLYIDVKQLKLLSKSIRPLPNKYSGLEDIELRYRLRYVDLIMNEEVRQTFKLRSRIIAQIRQFFDDRGYLEVETPMLQTVASGAIAKPFVTHHNALDQAMNLRVAPELYLKRLTVGGLEKVYEINRCFRNEGLSIKHNPEFTTLEFYEAYRDYQYLMTLTEQLLRQIVTTCFNHLTIDYQNNQIDFSQPFQRLTVADSILQFNTDLIADDLHDKPKLQSKVKALGLPVQDDWGIGKLQIEIFEKTVEHQLIQPTFILDYPREVSPLSRSKPGNPELTERFELFIAGFEVANGFSELNDSEEQASRFAEQMKNKQSGDDEAMGYDADYIRALEYAMPPTAGEGIGIDRLVMLLTNSQSIKDVLLFPTLKQELNQQDHCIDASN